MENQKKKTLDMGGTTLNSQNNGDIRITSIALFNALMECAKTYNDVKPISDGKVLRPSFKWRAYNRAFTNGNAMKAGIKKIINNIHYSSREEVFMLLDEAAKKAQMENTDAKLNEKMQACNVLYEIKAELEQEKSFEAQKNTDDGVTM